MPQHQDKGTLTDQVDGGLSGPGEGELSEPERVVVDKSKKLKSLKVRTTMTVLMIASFLLVIYGGHVPLMGMVFFIQTCVAKEIFAMGRNAQSERKVPLIRTQQWYFYIVATLFFYCRFIKNNLLVEITSTKALAKAFGWMIRYHTFVCYSMYIAGFCLFVLSLKRGMYLYQFGQFVYTHMVLMFAVMPGSLIVSNIYEGQIWFLLPAFLIVCNDICAYLAGVFWGKTPLIKLSPKKTWEGFFGGFVGTLILAFILTPLMANQEWFTCPRKDLTIFGPLHCERKDIYVPTTFTIRDVESVLPYSVVEYVGLLTKYLPEPVRAQLQQLTITASPMQFHALSLASFASIVGPFGGFFASGLKRAFKMKDFGDTIPGHGGITDRFDCQMLMATFSYVYYWNYIYKPELGVGEVLDLASQLQDTQQLELFGKLANLLVSEGMLPDSLVLPLARILPQVNATA